MHSTSIIDQLDRNIDALLAGAATPEHGDTLLTELTSLSHDLCGLPSADFQQRLFAELGSSAIQLTLSPMTEAKRLRLLGRKPAEHEVILPTLFADGAGLYRQKRSSYVASLAAHAFLLALLFTSGMWISKPSEPVNH